MNKLEQKILDSIQSDEVWMDNGEDLMQFTLTANITTITIDFAKGFNDFMTDKGISKLGDLGYYQPSVFNKVGTAYPIEHFINEYIKTL